MRFYSTNRKSKPVDFKTALFRGLAEDGGLYMPRQWPHIHKIESYKVHKVLRNFINIPEENLKKICDDAFNFPVPLVRLDENLYILELFHGPTLSFKDFGARFMARTMNYFLKKRKENLNIIVATSGDTGSAVADAFYELPNIKVFVLYPSKRISELQEKQIATLGKNIVAVEVKGDFDDCQHLAKTALADKNLRKRISLSSANSINIGRFLPQMFYYFKGYSQLKIGHPVLIVPSGNFGNLTAGLFAKKIGLPLGKFIAAVNKNSIVPDYLSGRKIKERKTSMTLSSAMDIGRPSNWARIADLFAGYPEAIKKDLEAITVSEKETRETIGAVYKKYKYLIDPHTAVGIAAAWRSGILGPKIILSTAHPAKFKEIIENATGIKLSLPKKLATVAIENKKSSVINPLPAELYKILAKE